MGTKGRSRRGSAARRVGLVAAMLVGLLAAGARPADASGTGVEDDVFELPATGPLTVPAPGVRINDTIPADTLGSPSSTYVSGDPFGGVSVVTIPGAPGITYSLSVLTPPTHGSVVLQTDGSFTYTPDGAAQDDTFVYQLTSSCTTGDCSYAGPTGQLDTATVTLTTDDPDPITPTRLDGADLVDDSYDLPATGSLELAAPGVRSNDTVPGDTPGTMGIYIGGFGVPGDPTYMPPTSYPGTPGFTYSIALLDLPEHGVVSLGGDGAVVYAPVDEPHDDAFTYRLTRRCTSGDCTNGGGPTTLDIATVTLTAPVPEGPGPDEGTTDPDPTTPDPDPTTPDPDPSRGEPEPDPSGGEPEPDGESGVLGAEVDASGTGTLPITGGDAARTFSAGLLLVAGGLVLRRLRRVAQPVVVDQDSTRL